MGIKVYTAVLMATLFVLLSGCGPMDVEMRAEDQAEEPEASRHIQAMSAYDVDRSREMKGMGGMFGGGSQLAQASYDMADEIQDGHPPTPDDALATLERQAPDRYLIKNAELTIETDDTDEASEALVSAVRELDGYVSDMNQSTDYYGRRSYKIVVRIPSNAFDDAMSRMNAIGKLIDQRITTQDVTEEFVDTDAKLRNLKSTEERLLDHLARTSQLDNILRIEEELTRVRSQIEQHEGRLRFMGHRIAYSTIRITLREPAKAEPIVPADSFSSAQVASQATRSLIEFLQRVWSRAIWLGIWAVVWVPGLVIGVLVLRILIVVVPRIPWRKPLTIRSSTNAFGEE